jgi:hypothetical protein
MKRLEKLFSDKVNAIKRDVKLRKVKAALNNAKLNLEEDLATATLEMEEATIQLADTEDVTAILHRILNAKANKEAAELGLKRIEEVMNYLNEDI